MTHAAPTTPEELFAGHPDALAAYERVRATIDGIGPCDVRTSKSQVAFRRRRVFASLWMPGQYLAKPTAEVVSSIVLDLGDAVAISSGRAHRSRCARSRDPAVSWGR